MPYALANDDSGLPLDVPANAAGWLVRRHAGGKGRPGAVYGADGRPLVVALDATADDLRTQGCARGSYRLDAIDADRRPLGVIAYTELASADDADAAGAVGTTTTAGSIEAALLAITRTMEAMQRVQAERERAQAEMFTKLIDRLARQAAPAAAAPAAAPLGWKDFEDQQKRFRNAVDAEIVRREEHAASASKAATASAAPEPSGTSDVESLLDRHLAPLIQTFGPFAQMWILKKLGLSGAEIAQLGMGAAPMPVPATAPVPVPSASAPTSSPSAAPAAVAATAPPAAAVPSVAVSPAAEQKFNAVMNALTEEERDIVFQALPLAPPQFVAMAEQQVLALSVDEAVAYLRRNGLPIMKSLVVGART